MKDNKQQIARIRQMERRLDRALLAVKRLSTALDKWEAVQEDIAALDKYYGSDEWHRDREDDAAGKLPGDLRRGVLSEDALYDTLSEADRLSAEIKKRRSRGN